MLTMGYIPAPSRGVLKIQAEAPAPNPDVAWWDTVSGNLKRFRSDLAQWTPVGEGDDYTGAVALGRPEIGLMPLDAVAIGDGATVTGVPA